MLNRLVTKLRRDGLEMNSLDRMCFTLHEKATKLVVRSLKGLYQWIPCSKRL